MGALLAVTAAFLLAQGGRDLAFAQQGRLYALTYGPDGRWLAGAGEDRQIRFWNPDDGSLIRTIFTDVELPRRLLVTPDGLVLVLASDSQVTTWSIRGRALHRFPVTAFEGLSSDGRFIIARQPLQFWDLRRGVREWAAPFSSKEPSSGEISESCPFASALAPDLRRGLSLMPRKIGMEGSDHEVYPLCSCDVALWTVAHPQDHRTVRLAACPQQRPAFDEDGQHVIVGGEGAALIWDVEDPAAKPLRLPVSGVVKGGLSIGHLQRVLLWGPEWVGVWDRRAQRLAWRSQKQPEPRSGFTVALSPSGEYVVAVGWSAADHVTVWSAATGRCVMDAASSVFYMGPHAVAFEPRGRALAYLDAKGRLRIERLSLPRE
jgi:WD40 repeat protein